MALKASETGTGLALVVAIEQHYPEGTRLIKDDVAWQMLPIGLRTYVWLTRFSWVRDWMVWILEKKAPGIWAMVLCRKRYIDDIVSEAVVGQAQVVVNLGAGFDTQAYRLPALANVPVWEVDQPVNIDAKRSKLNKVVGEIPAHVNLVSMDFDSQDLGKVLASNGYAADMTTFFILEGVTQYLTEVGIKKTFEFLAKAPAGSRLVFTYVPKDFMDGKVFYGHEHMYKKMVLKDEIWHFGIDPEDVADFLDRFGWRVLEHLGYEELAERYVKPTGRKLKTLAIERLVYAKKL